MVFEKTSCPLDSPFDSAYTLVHVPLLPPICTLHVHTMTLFETLFETNLPATKGHKVSLSLDAFLFHSLAHTRSHGKNLPTGNTKYLNIYTYMYGKKLQTQRALIQV